MNEKHLRKLFSTFHENGHKLYIVGGAVRDMILHEPVNDFDFTTDARPEEIIEMFDYTLSVGARYGTVQVLLDGEAYEITTFRSEKEYSDSRHPDQLKFETNLNLDLSRRDFTINALAMDKNGCIIDCFGGLEDIKQGVIRTINSPEERFKEDQLRKWRCIRFATQKGFEIDHDTYFTIVANPDTSMISIERIREELTKIILSKKINWGGYLLIRSGLYPNLLRRLIPGFLAKHLEFEDLIIPFEVMYFLPQVLNLRLAALALNFEYDKAKAFLSGLGYSKQLIEEVLNYHKFFNVDAESGIVNYKKAGAVLGIEGLKNLHKLQETVAFNDQNRERVKELEKTRELIKRIEENNEPLTRSDLAVDGNDLKRLGYQGREIGERLEALLEYIYENPEKNTKTELEKFLRES